MSFSDKYTGLLLEMLSFPALSREESARAGFLQKWLSEEGFTVNRTGNNLLVSAKNKKGKPGFLLCSHIDTVPPAKGWEQDPFVPVVEGNRISALGANDAGASVVAMIAAFENLALIDGNLEPQLLLCAEEEVSGKGGLESVLPELNNISMALVGEPTGMQPAVAQRGLMVVDASVKGKSGHAARNEGVNAISLAIKEIGKIQELSFPEPSRWLPEPSLQVTMIRAGSVHNVVPDECNYVIDVRSNDIYNNEDILKMLRGISDAELIPRSLRLKAKTLDEDHLLNRLIAEMGLKPFGSSTLSDMALLPFPSVKIGPGESARSHTSGEWISTDEIRNGIIIYTELGKRIISANLKEIS